MLYAMLLACLLHNEQSIVLGPKPYITRPGFGKLDLRIQCLCRLAAYRNISLGTIAAFELLAHTFVLHQARGRAAQDAGI